MISIMFGEIFKKYYKHVFVLLVLGGMAGYIQYLRHTVDKQRTEISTLENQQAMLRHDLDNAMIANRDLAQAIDQVNASLMELSTLTSNSKSQFDALNANVKIQTGQLGSRISRLMADGKPTTCEETIKYLIQFRREVSRP